MKPSLFKCSTASWLLLLAALTSSVGVAAARPAAAGGARAIKKRSDYAAGPGELPDLGNQETFESNQGGTGSGSVEYEYSEEEYVDEEEDEDEEDDDDDGSDCDNGNDDDDGSQWHIHDNDPVQPSDGQAAIFKRPEFPGANGTTATARTTTPFPKWLADLTKLSDWPGQNPPYVQVPGFELKDIPHVRQRGLGDCEGIDVTHCSFDCHRCTALDEIHTCPVLSQTFDDGPGPATMTLLDNLPGKTTFFTQGQNVVRFPDTFREQHARGHLLASHTWSHANLAGLPNEEVAAQIQWSIWAMNATAGIIPKYFRPPYGATDNRVRAIARKYGLTSVFWDRDTFDWKVNDKQKTSEEVIKDVRAWKEEMPQGLLLEHDSTVDVVNVGIQVAKYLAENDGRQLTVAECVNQDWYQHA